MAIYLFDFSSFFKSVLYLSCYLPAVLCELCGSGGPDRNKWS